MKKSVFFDFFNRQSDTAFKALLSDGCENIDYINWNDFQLNIDIAFSAKCLQEEDQVMNDIKLIYALKQA